MNVNKKQNLIRIIASVLIVLVVAGIWFIKNNSEKDGAANPDFELEATALDLDQLKSYGLPIVIDFGSDSCNSCKEMAPVLEELNTELQGKAIVKFVDVSKYPSAAEGLPIAFIPTQLFFDKNGNPFVPSDPQAMGMKLYPSNITKKHAFTVHGGGMTKEQFMNVLSEMGIEE